MSQKPRSFSAKLIIRAAKKIERDTFINEIEKSISNLEEKRRDIIANVVGSLKWIDIENFLIEKCKIQEPDLLLPEEIVAHCRQYLHPGPVGVETVVRDGKIEIPKEPLELSKEQQSLALLVKHPDWTNKQIAKKIGAHEKSLSRWPVFRRAREMQKTGRKNFPNGIKDGQTGDLEAWHQR